MASREGDALELQRIANHFLYQLIERFVGGPFQCMPEQPEAEIGIEFFRAGIGLQADVGQMVVEQLWF